jgi:hypothetical protein
MPPCETLLESIVFVLINFIPTYTYIHNTALKAKEKYHFCTNEAIFSTKKFHRSKTGCENETKKLYTPLADLIMAKLLGKASKLAAANI